MLYVRLCSRPQAESTSLRRPTSTLCNLRSPLAWSYRTVCDGCCNASSAGPRSRYSVRACHSEKIDRSCAIRTQSIDNWWPTACNVHTGEAHLTVCCVDLRGSQTGTDRRWHCQPPVPGFVVNCVPFADLCQNSDTNFFVRQHRTTTGRGGGGRGVVREERYILSPRAIFYDATFDRLNLNVRIRTSLA